MPRKSAEALSAAHFRTAGKRPEPPAELSEGAKARWRSIVGCRAPDYFQAGSLDLLALFVMHAEAAYRAGLQLQDTPDDDALSKLMDRHTGKAASLAIKLRITTSAEHGGRKAADQGIRDEKGTPLNGLLGGHAITSIETRRAN